MAWDTTLVTIVRVFINDMSGTPTYTDDQIKTAILTGGLIATQDFPFDVTYNFDFANTAITPDPTLDPVDLIAINLFSLKAACILNQASYQSSLAGGIGVSIKDWNSSVSTEGVLKGFADLLKYGVCATYTDLVEKLYFSKGAGKGGAVLGPYTGTNNSATLPIGFSHLAQWDSFVTGNY